MAGSVAAEPQLTKANAEMLIGYGLGATGAPPATSPDIKAAGDAFRGGNEDRALKIVTGDVLPYSADDVDQTLIKRLGTQRDQDGRKVGAANYNEARRIAQCQDVANDVRQFVENNIQSPSLRSDLANYLINNVPIVRDIVTSSPDRRAAINAIVDTMFDDASFKDSLREMYNKRLDPAQKSAHEQNVQNLRSQLNELEAQLSEAVDPADIKIAERRLRDAQTQLSLDPNYAEYARRNKTFETIGRRLETLENDLQRYEAVGRPLAQKKEALESEKAALDQNAGNYGAEVKRIDNLISQIDKDVSYRSYAAADAQINLYENLKGELPQLAKQIIPLQEELNDAQSELTTLQDAQKKQQSPQDRAKIESQVNQKRAELADAEDQMEAEMIRFAREVTHMPQDAAEAYLNEAFTRLKTNWKEEATKKTTKENTDKEALAQIAVDRLTNRWREDVTEKGITIKKPNKDNALAFLAEVFKPGGVANVEASITNLTDAQLAGLGMTPQEISAFKAKWSDAEFRTTQADALAKQAMADYFVAGGRMSKNMVIALTSSEWGKTLLDQGRAQADTIIAAAKGKLGKNVMGRMDEIKNSIDEMKNASAESIAKNWWKWGIAIVLLFAFLGIKGVGG